MTDLILNRVLLREHPGRPMRLEISGGRIRAAGTLSAVPIPADADKINGSGKFLMPEPIDLNEGAKILEEKIAIRPSDIDIVWVNGYGWPVYRGGPMFYGDTVGLQTVVEKLKEYGPKLGKDFRISPLLEKLAAEGKRFQDLK